MGVYLSPTHQVVYIKYAQISDVNHTSIKRKGEREGGRKKGRERKRGRKGERERKGDRGGERETERERESSYNRKKKYDTPDLPFLGSTSQP